MSRFDWERMEKLVLGAWLTALIWPYANSGGFPAPLLLSVLPLALALAEWLPNGVVIFLADAAAVLLELIVQRPAGLTSLGALRHLFAVLLTENPAAWTNMPEVVGLLLIVAATVLGWLVYRQAVTRGRVLLLFVLGILVLAVNHVYWNLSVEAPLAAYLLFGLWLLAETHLAESANRNPQTPRTGWYLFAAALVAAPFWIGWNTPAGPSHVLHPTVTRPGGGGPGAGSGRGAGGRYGNDVSVFNIGTGIGDTNINHPVRPTNQPVMAVSGMPGPSYWQIAVYDNFDGVKWTAPAGSAYRFSAGEFAHQFFPPEVTGFPVSTWDVTVEFLLGGTTVNTVAYAGTPVQVVDASSTRSGTVYQGREELVSPGYTYYQLIAQVPTINWTAVAGAPATAAPASLAPDLEIPTNLSPKVATLARQITAKASGPWQEAEYVKAYLDTHEQYTYHFRPGGTNAVNQFLLVTHAGYCDQFSSAFIMMMRTLGVPARWVVGYAPGTYQPRHHDYVITTLDAHSWAEIYVSPYGWIPVDPTPGFTLPTGGSNTPPATHSHNAGHSSHPPVVPPVGHHARGHKGKPLAPVLWPTVLGLLLIAAFVVLLRRIRTARWRIVRERALWRLLNQLSWLRGSRSLEGRTLRDTFSALPQSLRPLALPAVRVLERSWYAGETVPESDIEDALRDLVRARRLAMREWLQSRTG